MFLLNQKYRMHGALVFAAMWALAYLVMPTAAAEDAKEKEAMFDDVVDVAVAIAAPAGPVVADAQMQQFRAQFEPMLKVELSFINRVCKPSDAKRQALVARSNKWLDTLIRDYAKKGGQPNVDGAWFGGPMPNAPNPRESLEESLMKLVKGELPEEQVKIYDNECRKREEFQKEVAVENLVSKIDGELMLSPDQRNKLTESLAGHWQKSWAPQLEFFMFGVDMWPNVPEQWIRPHLSAAQQVAWSKLNKQSGNTFFGGNFFGMQGQVIDDIDLHEGNKKAKDEKQPNDDNVANGRQAGAAVAAEPVADR